MADTPATRSTWTIKIGTADLSQDLEGDLEEITVDSSLQLPDMFTIRLQAPHLRWIDDARFDFGVKVILEAQAAAGRDKEGVKKGKLIEAEITALEPEFSAQGNHSFLIRGYDQSNRLHFGRHSHTYLKTTDKKIVEEIAGKISMGKDVDPTTGEYEYVIQYNQTYMEFLAERARRIGYQVFAMDNVLSFKKGDYRPASPLPVMEIGEDLLSFRPRQTVAHQADKVRVVGWNPKTQQRIEATATTNRAWNQGGMSEPGGDIVKSKFLKVGAEAEVMVVHYPVVTQDEANALAAGMASDLSSTFVEAEGVCYGDPRIKAGVQVELKELGSRFSGKYFVTSATHVHRKDGYLTYFTVSGRQPNTVNHLLERRNGAGDGHGRISGVVVATVDNLDDPDDMGRVRVIYPWLLDKTTEIVSAWARVSAPMAGQAKKGTFFLPEIKDEVLVAFEHGDMNRPYIVGALWNGAHEPPQKKAKVLDGSRGKVNLRIIRSRSGHEIVFDDSDGAEKFSIIDKTTENSILIDSTKNSMDINVKGDLTITVGGNIKISAGQGQHKLDIGAGGIKAQTPNNVELTPTQEFKVTAMKASINGSTEAEIVSMSSSVIGTSAVDIQGAQVSVQGAMIKLN